MLALTDRAATAIRTLTEAPQVPDAAGLRIASDGSDDGTLMLMLADAPQEGDQIVERAGAMLFMDTDAAAILDAKMIDAVVTEQGEVQFTIADR